MAYEDVRLTHRVTKRATLSPSATGPKLALNVLGRRTSSVLIKQGASLSLRVVNEAI